MRVSMIRVCFALFVLTALAAALPAPALAQWSFVCGIGADPGFSPGAAEFDGKEWLFFRKTLDGEVGYITTSSPTGGGFSGVSTFITGANTPEPSAIAFNGRLYAFFSEYNGSNRILYTSRTSTGSWAFESQVPGASTRHRPALAVFNNQLYIFWEVAGSNNDIRYSILSASGSFSGPYTVPGGVQTGRAPAAAVFNGRLYVVFTGESGSGSWKLWYTSMNSSGAWAAQQKIGGEPSTSFPPSAMAFGGELHVYYTGASSSNLLRKRLNTGGSWSGEEWILGLGAFGGTSANVFSTRAWLTGPGNSVSCPHSIAYLTF